MDDNHRSPCLEGREDDQLSNVTGDLGYSGMGSWAPCEAPCEAPCDAVMIALLIVSKLHPWYTQGYIQGYTQCSTHHVRGIYPKVEADDGRIPSIPTRKKSPALSKAFILVPMVSTLLWNDIIMVFVLCPHDKQLYKREDKRGREGTTGTHSHSM